MVQSVELSSRLQQAWQEWTEAVDGLNNRDYDSPNVYPHWNLKDVMGHVFSYELLMLKHAQAYRKRKRLASPRAPSYAYFNRREAARLKNVSLAQLRDDMNETHSTLMELLPTLTSADMKKQFPAQWTNSQYHTTLRYLLRETAEHMRNHARDVKLWRSRQDSS
jgi:hypothetical protein